MNPIVAAEVAKPGTITELAKMSRDVTINYQKRAESIIRPVIYAGVIGTALYFARRKFIEWRKQQFVEKNAHIPDVQAAMIMRKSMFKIENDSFPWSLITIPDGTDEDMLNELALKVSSLEAVIKAYSILFESNLITDVYSELNNKEMQEFFNNLGAKSEYDLGFTAGGGIKPQTPLKIGQNVAIKNPNGSTIYEAESIGGGKYKNSGEKLDFKPFGEEIGTITGVYKGTSTGQYYYVIDRKWAVDTIFGYGWIAHTEIKISI